MWGSSEQSRPSEITFLSVKTQKVDFPLRPPHLHSTSNSLTTSARPRRLCSCATFLWTPSGPLALENSWKRVNGRVNRKWSLHIKKKYLHRKLSVHLNLWQEREVYCVHTLHTVWTAKCAVQRADKNWTLDRFISRNWPLAWFVSF